MRKFSLHPFVSFLLSLLNFEEGNIAGYIGKSVAPASQQKNPHSQSGNVFFLETTLFITTIACFPHPLYQQGEGKPAIVIKRGGYKMK